MILHPPSFSLCRNGRAILAALLLSLCGSCTVVGTLPVISENGQACNGRLGSYFLPRNLLTFTVTQKDAEAFQFKVEEPVADADRGQTFCLDYLGSPFADDTVNVIRDPALGVLLKIASTNEDKSKEVALTALQIGLIAVTGNPNVTRKVTIKSGADGDPVILADYTFDPFNRLKLAEVNAVMAGVYGYCAIIDGHTLDVRDIQSYCNAPLRYTQRRHPLGPGDLLPVVAPEEANRGILYRPNQTHQLIVFRRRDPQSRTVWQLFQTKRIEMPNVSQTFSVGVERSAFVTRKTTLEFDRGVLRDITIEKESEVLAFVEIPLRVVQAMVQVPAEIIKVRVSAINNEKEIINAQAGLIQTQRATAEAIANLRKSGSIAPSDGTAQSVVNRGSQLTLTGDSRRSAQDFAQCELLCAGDAACRVAKCGPPN